MGMAPADAPLWVQHISQATLLPLQVTKYVEREIINHRCLMHPHIVQFKEVNIS